MLQNLLYLFMFGALFSCAKSTIGISEDESFTNPLLPEGPDPWVIKKDSFYYYTNTLSDRICIWKTKSMSRLSSAEKKMVWTPPTRGENSYDIWAPELHFLDGKWYIYYTAGSTPDHNNQRLFVLENGSADPLEGTWVSKGRIADTTNDIYAIDATVFENNGRRYLLWSSLPTGNFHTQALFIAEMSNPWTLATGRSEISLPTYAWEKKGSSQGNGVNEGPEILRGPDKQIFLVYSASSCSTDNYSLGLMNLRQNSNPLVASNWTKNMQPVLSTQPKSKVYAPGHCAFFKSPDGKEDWLLYHAKSAPNQGCSIYRNPRIQKFTWNADGTPAFGEPVASNVKFARPSGEKD